MLVCFGRYVELGEGIGFGVCIRRCRREEIIDFGFKNDWFVGFYDFKFFCW